MVSREITDEVAILNGYISNLRQVHQFYSSARAKLLASKIKPNPAHIAFQVK